MRHLQEIFSRRNWKVVFFDNRSQLQRHACNPDLQRTHLLGWQPLGCPWVVLNTVGLSTWSSSYFQSMPVWWLVAGGVNRVLRSKASQGCKRLRHTFVRLPATWVRNWPSKYKPTNLHRNLTCDSLSFCPADNWWGTFSLWLFLLTQKSHHCPLPSWLH